MDSDTSLIEFPTEFPIKVVGKKTDDLLTLVSEIIIRYVPEFDVSKIEKRFSRRNNYLSLTCTIQATSQSQLDKIYGDLTNCESVIMAF